MILYIILFVAGAACAFPAALVILKRRNRKERKRVTLDTFVKIIVTAVVAHGMLLTSCSYILSALGHDPVVDVSSTIVREIVAPVAVYLITNMVMNIFEKNKLSFSEPISNMNDPDFNVDEAE